MLRHTDPDKTRLCTELLFDKENGKREKYIVKMDVFLCLRRRQQHDETGAATSGRACRSSLAETDDSDGRH